MTRIPRRSRLPIFAAALFLALGTALAGPPAAVAAGPQASDPAWNLCLETTTRAERTAGIPTALLTAISRAESGRWNEGRGENLAWPWTVTAEGQGRFFASKGQAVAAVRRLQAKGVRNIDVGCMQVNLYYHPDAFADLQAAFDPGRNVDYAVRFLAGLRDQTGSWRQAAAHYHSSDPARNRGYLDKVVRLWKAAKKTAPATATADAGWPSPELQQVAMRFTDPFPPIDHQRTQILNARLRQAREAARQGTAATSTAASAATAATAAPANGAFQLATGAKNRRVGNGQTAAALAADPSWRRAFADKRRAQLSAWRAGRGLPRAN